MTEEYGVTPLMIETEDEGGVNVPIDVALMVAKNLHIRELIYEALENYFKNGGVPDHAVRLSITFFDMSGNTSTAITVDDMKSIDLEEYSPEQDAIIARRTGIP